VSSGLALVFPGQGSQFVGMGKSWAERFATARDVFEEADEVLGMSLSGLCWEGPEAELQLTVNTQPALLTTAIAMHRAMAPLGLEPDFVAGHSLGEYTALVAAGSVDFADALRLVRQRGRFMQEAVPVGQGAMAAILGLEVDQLESVTASVSNGEVCSIANLNAPGQTVIAGHAGAVALAIERAKELGARRAILLPVSAPFHSPLMAPARENLAPFLDQTRFADPATPVVSNIDAEPVITGNRAREALKRQIDGPVRWVESIEWISRDGGVESFIEVGPGKVLTGLIRRISPSVEAEALGEPDSLEDLAERLGNRS